VCGGHTSDAAPENYDFRPHDTLGVGGKGIA
jgi:hypothetical protein